MYNYNKVKERRLNRLDITMSSSISIEASLILTLFVKFPRARFHRHYGMIVFKS